MRKTPAQVYEDIKQNPPPNIDGIVLRLIKRHRGDKTIERRTLIEKVFGITIPPDYNLANSKEDRQIRRSLKRLSKTNAIIGTSGRKGYSYPTDARSIFALIDENNRKIRSLAERNSALKKIAETEFGGLIPLPGLEKTSQDS